MTPETRETAIKWLQNEIRSLRLAPKINGCGPENWQDQLEIMETCLEAVRDYHFPDTRKMVPLTLEQLRGMDDKAIRVRVLESDCQGLHTGIVTMYDPNDSDNGVYVGCAFRCIKDYGKTWLAYAYPPAHIDREAWKECPWCKSEYTVIDDDFGQPVHPNMIKFCWNCGRPMTSIESGEIFHLESEED